MKGSSVRISGVEKSFDGEKILDGINLEIQPGEFFSILGPSGCGKTTLLRLIAGFVEPDKGEILLGNQRINGMPPNRRNVNTIFQSYALFPHLTVFENVAFPLRVKKLPKEQIEEEVMRHLAMVKLERQRDRRPHQISGGQKQRVAIARALVNHPEVLLLDEPLSALDAKLRHHMLMELDAIHDQVGITFIFITHDQQEALSVSDRIAVMDEGRILQVGTPAEIYESPATAFVADFIGETNLIEGTVKEVKTQGSVPTGVMQSDLFGSIVFQMDKPCLPGDRVTITLRPEKVRISRSRPELVNPNHNVLEGTVEDLIYSGFQTRFFVAVSAASGGRPDSEVRRSDETESAEEEETAGDGMHDEELLEEGMSLIQTQNRIRVYRQHVEYVESNELIKWKEKVFLFWNCEDAYLVEVEHAGS